MALKDPGHDPEQCDRGEPPLEEASSPPQPPFLSQHLAVVGAIALTLFALVKAYAAANFSLTTASALLTTAPLNVLLGTLTSYSYQIFPLLGLAALTWAIMSFNNGEWMMGLVASGFSILALLLSPWRNLWPPALILATLIGSLTLLKRHAARYHLHGELQPHPSRRMKRIPQRLLNMLACLVTRIPLRAAVTAFFVGVSLFVVIKTLSSLWLPVEVLTYGTDGDRKIVVGHVLNVDSEWTTVVRAGDKKLSRLPTDAVKSREICHLGGVQPRGRRPILWVVRGKYYSSPNTYCDNLVKQTEGRLVPGSLPD
jgi:hypothetical protein